MNGEDKIAVDCLHPSSLSPCLLLFAFLVSQRASVFCLLVTTSHLRLLYTRVGRSLSFFYFSFLSSMHCKGIYVYHRVFQCNVCDVALELWIGFTAKGTRDGRFDGLNLALALLRSRFETSFREEKVV
jgi:hypothetical protein